MSLFISLLFSISLWDLGDLLHGTDTNNKQYVPMDWPHACAHTDPVGHRDTGTVCISSFVYTWARPKSRATRGLRCGEYCGSKRRHMAPRAMI